MVPYFETSEFDPFPTAKTISTYSEKKVPDVLLLCTQDKVLFHPVLLLLCFTSENITV